MILYNVTINIESDVHDAWLKWMKETHLPMVMATGKFVSYSMYKILSRQEDETGETYSIQYLAEDMDSYEEYRQKYAPALQDETMRCFTGKFVAFRTVLELEHEYQEV